jgi:glycosyltransferase involved in cell wall biosynthesis
VGDLVEMVGYVTHLHAVEELVNADVLFAPLHGLPPGRRSLIVPGKIYEYLRSGRPILGCLPAGEARELVEQAGGTCADPCSSSEIADGLSRLLDSVGERRSAGSSSAPAWSAPEWIKAFERRALSKRLAAFLDLMTGEKTGNEGCEVDAKHSNKVAVHA